MFTAPRTQPFQARNLIPVFIAIGLGAMAMPALAKSTGDDSPHRMTIEQKNGETVYCIVDQGRTGSRVPTKVCQNRAKWAANGLVIPGGERAADGKKKNPEG